MTRLLHIILYLFDQPGQCMLLDTPVIVKKGEVSIYECWGMALHDTVWLLDENNEWSQLSEEDQNFLLVVEAIEKRIDERVKMAEQWKS